VQDGLLRIGVERVIVGHLVNRELVDAPAMALGHGIQLISGFRQRHIEAAFAVRNAFQQKLKADGGLAGAWFAFNEIYPLCSKATAQDIVQAGHTGLDTAGGFACCASGMPGFTHR
jgi:hypothetical protein